MYTLIKKIIIRQKCLKVINNLKLMNYYTSTTLGGGRVRKPLQDFSGASPLTPLSNAKGEVVKGVGAGPRYMAPALQYLNPNVSSNCLVVSVKPLWSFFPTDLSESVSSCCKTSPSRAVVSLQ
jgi:hypothetical protein